ncbi:RagB/SusD family nutrient uptake outer membrane protein [Pontibacter sp. G13]|uniref:RagB/SusD family nutrient uptake outer membrane protein n=1 Tax=Pontibacter sp. G13 TaxID=3074898 RepID=UPI00288BADB7|nr:RagB/SusD family nutrient uptake outer membrane protein [Pontibacter sp. G13]WNJ20642.1 RagB/SusD family nutrient uptake outer membrane protein [Pontibacter sp. G13]
MKKYSFSYFLGACLIFLSACNGFLDEAPLGQMSSETFFETEEDLRFGSTGLYDILNSNNLYGHTISLVGDLGADIWTHNGGFVPFEELDRYSFTSNMNIGNIWWVSNYRGIARCNFYIKGVQNSEFAGTAVAERYLGEAYFIRALLYFNLVRTYGDVPLDTVGAEDLSQIYTRDATEDVYTAILNDLQRAKEILPVIQAQKGRATRGAAHGLLVKTYLTMAGQPLNKGMSHYQLALQEAISFEDSVVAGAYPYELLDDYPSIFSEINENNAEIVFDVQAIAGPQEGTRWGKWGGWDGPQNDIDFASNGAPKAVPSFYDSYSVEDIIRQNWNILDSFVNANGALKFRTNPTQYSIAKFRPEFNSFEINGEYVSFQSPHNTPILRYDDVLLMLAEAENEVNGPTELAYEMLNRVRERVKITPLTASNFSELYPEYQAEDAGIDLNVEQDRFREAIFWERAWELCYEGHRRFDLIRWGRLVPTVQNLMPTQAYVDLNNAQPVNRQLFSPVNIREHHALFPIPQQEMDVAQNDFVQNEGY